MADNKNKKPVCCLCGNECENEWGNNPWPLSTKVEDRCCNVCNSTKVIPARLKQAYEDRKGE